MVFWWLVLQALRQGRTVVLYDNPNARHGMVRRVMVVRMR